MSMQKEVRPSGFEAHDAPVLSHADLYSGIRTGNELQSEGSTEAIPEVHWIPETDHGDFGVLVLVKNAYSQAFRSVDMKFWILQ
ncbi:hypothetical protein Tdes44962_MAKER03529 [Teratosphaeria destructans]|uniref:Uncharacterized protein n=1 Tax=Teratosphaeria destructans TaxID=418781 RepID=A0A9W7SPR0_9PEZI|nr:hypothetical protein Tdes44962_MAKER03529 [Teratosphaeria destructans]